MGEGHFFSGKVVMWKMRAGTKFFTITFTRLVHLCFHLQGDLCCISRQNTEQSFLSVVAGQVVSSLTISTYSFSLLSLQIYHCPQDLNLYLSLSLSFINHNTIPLITLIVSIWLVLQVTKWNSYPLGVWSE